MDDQMPARKIDDSPFCWQSKAALWRIREAFDGSYLDQALAVYLIHCELASDAQAASYDARLRKIVERSGVSRSRVAQIHSRFKELKLLDWTQNRIEGTKELAASTFILLKLSASGTTPSTSRTTPSKIKNKNWTDNKESIPNNLPVKIHRERVEPTEAEIINAARELGIPARIAKDFFLHKDANRLWFNASGEAINIKSGLRQWVRIGRKRGDINFTDADLKSQCDAEISREKARQQSGQTVTTTPPGKPLTWEQRHYRQKKETATAGTPSQMISTPETISPAATEPAKPMTDEQRQKCAAELHQLREKL